MPQAACRSNTPHLRTVYAGQVLLCVAATRSAALPAFLDVKWRLLTRLLVTDQYGMTQPIIKEDGHDQRDTEHRMWIEVWTDLLQPIDQLRRTPRKRFKLTMLLRIAI